MVCATVEMYCFKIEISALRTMHRISRNNNSSLLMNTYAFINKVLKRLKYIKENILIILFRFRFSLARRLKNKFHLFAEIPSDNKKRQKIIYIRSPKTASSSLIRSIGIFGLSYSRINQNNMYQFDDSKILIIASELYKKHNSYFLEKYPNHLRICIVRNPYFKFLSSKNYCKTTKGSSTLEVLRNLPQISEDVHDWGHLTRTQTAGLIYNGRKQYDKLFYYENYKSILDFIGTHFDVALMEQNANVTKSYSVKLSVEEKNLIKQIYRIDFDNFYPLE